MLPARAVHHLQSLAHCAKLEMLHCSETAFESLQLVNCSHHLRSENWASHRITQGLEASCSKCAIKKRSGRRENTTRTRISSHIPRGVLEPCNAKDRRPGVRVHPGTRIRTLQTALLGPDSLPRVQPKPRHENSAQIKDLDSVARERATQYLQRGRVAVSLAAPTQGCTRLFRTAIDGVPFRRAVHLCQSKKSGVSALPSLRAH